MEPEDGEKLENRLERDAVNEEDYTSTPQLDLLRNNTGSLVRECSGKEER